MTVLNGVDADEVRDMRRSAAGDPRQARRSPHATARWVGGDASRVECGAGIVHLGGDGNLNPMEALLTSVAACEVDVIATHAALLGLQIEDLEVDATGRFDLRSYLGLEDAPGSGYEAITCRVRLRAPGATPAELAYLRERCRRSSPVVDSLVRPVPIRTEITLS